MSQGQLVSYKLAYLLNGINFEQYNVSVVWTFNVLATMGTTGLETYANKWAKLIVANRWQIYKAEVILIVFFYHHHHTASLPRS